ncbi:MAG: STAS domain-containing protein [Zhaonellaceae bacterium]|jgi:anti-anti-sigma factor|nr:STAS domain-containing protein [Clostridia bacterium]
MVQIEQKNGDLVVYLKGELTYENTNEIKEEIKTYITKDTQRIIIELSELELIDSSGVGVFISLLRRMQGEGVFLVAPQPKVARIFEITKLNQIIPIYAKIEEAGNEMA